MQLVALSGRARLGTRDALAYRPGCDQWCTIYCDVELQTLSQSTSQSQIAGDLFVDAGFVPPVICLRKTTEGDRDDS